MGCYYIYKGKQYQELDNLYPVLLGEMEKEASVVKVENGKETTVKINTELFPDKRDVTLKLQNLFTVKPIQATDKKAVIKASVATQYIGFGEGITGSSTENYRQQAGKFANTGNYSSNDVIFVSIGGKRGNEQIRKEQQDRTIKEALKAIEAGATLITDNKSYVESSTYNEGEKRLAKNLEAKGYIYSEQTINGQLLGIWKKQQVNSVLSNKKREGKQGTNIFTTKINQFNYSYNPITNEVIHNAKTGDKVETNQTQINKVLVAYAKANNFPIQNFNKQSYVYVNGKVLNSNTGAEVNNPKILTLFNAPIPVTSFSEFSSNVSLTDEDLEQARRQAEASDFLIGKTLLLRDTEVLVAYDYDYTLEQEVLTIENINNAKDIKRISEANLIKLLAINNKYQQYINNEIEQEPEVVEAERDKAAADSACAVRRHK